jgi:protein-tyrosine-phosphatase
MPPAFEPSSVLFICSWNAIRSPMAEGLAKRLLGTRLYVDSAGLRAGTPNPFAVSVMREIGIDIEGHRAKTVEEIADESFDLVVSLSPEAQHHAVEMTRTTACEVEFWNTFDPSLVEGSRETRLDAFRQVRDGLDRRIRARFAGRIADA